MSLLQQLNQWSGLLIVILFVLLAATAAAAIRTGARLGEMKRLWQKHLQGVDAENVEHLLIKHLDERSKQGLELEQVRHRLHTLEAKMLTAKRFTGLVRYDAFEGVGGEQSFSLASFDDMGNGFVVSSQIGRADSRVFGKKLVEGKCDKGLTEEEEAAIREAAGAKSRPQITPDR